MYIKEINLNGFKSYGQARSLANMDKHFNAITGLNGSGKSNILDSICFVLGQNAPSQFRVNSMQELVYKKGAGGISFASVEIVFDNSQRLHKPSRFGDCDIIRVERKIVLGPQNKSRFTINGTTCTHSEVLDFFRSVQLNIQNPHFLIMQGRITKVLNMKPEEIWKMVEEAAGTMVYVSKRDATRKVLAAKEKHIHEIEEAYKDLILPKVSRLKEERKNMIEFQKLNRELEGEQRLLLAVQVYEHKIKGEKMKAEREKLKGQKELLEEEIKKITEEQVNVKNRIQELENGDEGDESGTLKRLEEEYDACKKALTRKQGSIEANNKRITEEEKRITNHRSGIEKENQGIAVANETLAKVQQELTSAEAKKAELDAELEKATQALQVVVTGMGGQGNEEFGWKNQHDAAVKQKDDLNRQIRINEGKLTNLDTELKDLNRKMSLNSANKEILKQIETKQKVVDGLKSQETSFPQVDETRMGVLDTERRNLVNQKRQLEFSLNSINNNLGGLQLPYEDPGQGFDRRKVLGAVAEFLVVKDAQRFIPAVDTVAGGRKFCYVVEDDNTAQLLLNHGRIKKRVTILPLNRIRAGKVVSPNEISRIAAKYGSENVWRAVDLVEPNERLQGVIEYALGSHVVCADDDIANNVCREFKVQTVSVDGNSFHPDGISSGGKALRAEEMTMFHVCKSQTVKQQMRQLDGRLEEVEEELSALLQRQERRKGWENQVGEKQKELDLLRSKCENNDAVRVALDAEKVKADIEKLKEDVQKDRSTIKDLDAKIKELSKKMSSDNAAELEKAEAQKALKKAEDAVKAQETLVEKIGEKMAEIQNNIEAAQEAIQGMEQEIIRIQGEIRDLQVENERTTIEIDPFKKAAEKAFGKFDTLRQSISEKNEGLRNAKTEEKALDKRLKNANDEMEKQDAKMKKQKEELKNVQEFLNQAFIEHPWTGDEYEKFGTAESTYKVDGLHSGQLLEKVHKLQKKRDEMKKTTDTEVNNDFDYVVKKEEDILKKVESFKANRKMFNKVIEELDRTKQALIEECVTVVNEHFGNIFGTLLNGAHCKLERERDERNRPLEALRIRVGFGKKGDKVLWKESLSELSGGQRSLVALSLVLAMLRMNPAPIYVLDEIDAALDLSHTQNVGKMIRKYFSQSQFIIVSLKEGMFTNANCIYKITLENGVSQVKREAKAVTHNDKDDQMDEE